MANQKIHDKNIHPKNIGNYWALATEIIGNQKVTCDSGWARWDGEKWNRDDFDFWYGEEEEKK